MNVTMKALTAVSLIFAMGISPVFASVDLRAGVGLLSSDDDALGDEVEATAGGGNLSWDDFETFNGDIFFNFDDSPLGLGFRYERWNQDQSTAFLGINSSIDLEVNNAALLVDLRIIDDPVFYVGPIVSVGYPWADVEVTVGAATSEKTITPKAISYTGGLEAGIYLGPILLGAEAGYLGMEFDEEEVGTVTADVDLSGFYGKALIGIRFGYDDDD